MFGIPLILAGNTGPSQAQFESQANTGLNVKLEYVNSNTIKLSSNSGSTISVITPDLKTIDVSTSGLTATVSGSTSTLYYVYLASTGLSFSTSATDTNYTNMKTLSGNKILLGYMGCSASNAIAGTHNVFSYWNEPQRSYTQSTNTINSTALVLNGFILPPGKTATVTWSGSVTGTSTWNAGQEQYYVWRDLGNQTISVTSTTLGNTSGSRTIYFSSPPWACEATLYRTNSLFLNNNSISSGVTNTNVFLSGSVSNSISAPYCTTSLISSVWSSVSGTITLTRPSS